MTKTKPEIIREGYRALIDSLGVIDTIKFIQYYSSGQGNYTQERNQWLDRTPLEDILISMKQHSKDDNERYDEIIH